jgi:hypothetical protein
MGVLFLPSLYLEACKLPQASFSCTSSLTLEQPSPVDFVHFTVHPALKAAGVGANESDDKDAGDCLRVQMPLPFNLQPAAYEAQDQPWVWDLTYEKLDVHGFTWKSEPRQQQRGTGRGTLKG